MLDISTEYNKALSRNLGLKNETDWVPFIEKIIKVLEIDFKEFMRTWRFTEASNKPGSTIVREILKYWCFKKGTLWEDIITLNEKSKNSLKIEYELNVKPREEIIRNLDPLWVYTYHEEVSKFMSSENTEYLKLRSIAGQSVNIWK